MIQKKNVTGQPLNLLSFPIALNVHFEDVSMYMQSKRAFLQIWSFYLATLILQEIQITTYVSKYT